MQERTIVSSVNIKRRNEVRNPEEGQSQCMLHLVQKKLLKRVSLSVNREKYPEVIHKLESVQYRNGYIIDLILKDIGKAEV